MRTRFASTARRLLLSLVATVLAVLSVGAIAAPASAVPIGPCADLRHFTLNFRTGGDDLRNNSEVVPTLLTRRGDVALQSVWGPIGNETTREYSVTFQVPATTVSSCDVRGVRLRLVSHNDWFQTNDNWNMDFFSIDGFNGSNTLSYFLSASGSPVKRFTGSDSTFEKIDMP